MNDIIKLHARIWIAILLSWLLCTATYAASQVGIIMPELRAPFNEIFDAVADGVDNKFRDPAVRLVLKKNHSPVEITNWLRAKNISSVIALGSLGKKAVAYVPKNTPIVLGGLFSAASSTNLHPGLALTAEPGAMFALLKKLDKSRNKVVVVYNPLKYKWLIDLAKRQAANNGVQLVAYEATNLKQAAIIYDEILSQSMLDKTALWLLQDRTVVDSKVVLPFILEKTWQKDMVVFSSALGHVSKGVLFAMYPNNIQHGEQLADMLIKVKSGSSKFGNKLFPSQGLQKAINSRTAEHLGIKTSKSELREYDVVFPVSN